MEKTIKPAFSRVLIQKKADDKIGSIVVPLTAKQGQHGTRASVIDVGPDCVTVKPGDEIFYGVYAFTELPVKYSEDLRHYHDILIINEEDIIAFIKE